MPVDTSNHDTPPRDTGAPPQYPGYPPYPYHAPADDEIDLRELWNVVWQGKWIITAVTAVFAVASVFYALFLPNIYQSKALLAPSADSQGGGMSKMVGQLGGLASLAGINVGGTAGDDKVAVAIEVLKSRKFIGDVVRQHDLLPELFAVKEWNLESGELIFHPDIYIANEKRWVRKVDLPRAPEPSALEAHKEFMEILTVSQNKETGFVTVSVEHQSPVAAKKLVALLVDNVNVVMKDKDVAEARRSIEFLEKQLANVALTDMRTVFYQLIEEQTKTVMLAEVRDEYIFSTIDPPVVAEEHIKPKRALIVALGVLLGIMLSLMFVLTRHFLRAGDGGQHVKHI